MNVSAIIVTRGDHDREEILRSLPDEWERVIWDNSKGVAVGRKGKPYSRFQCPDLGVYGRYAAIPFAHGDLIYVQDDDCVIENAQEIVSKWIGTATLAGSAPADGSDLANVRTRDHIIANMPVSRWEEFPDSCLVGWGACFHRDLPRKAFNRFLDWAYPPPVLEADAWPIARFMPATEMSFFLRECDLVFATLTPHTKIDVGFRHLPWAEGPGRMFTENPEQHRHERQTMLELCRKVRDNEGNHD